MYRENGLRYDEYVVFKSETLGNVKKTVNKTF